VPPECGALGEGQVPASVVAWWSVKKKNTGPVGFFFCLPQLNVLLKQTPLGLWLLGSSSPAPWLFSSCACPAAHSHLHRHPCSSPLPPPPLLLPPPKLPPLLLPPPFRIAFDTTDTCLLLLPSMRQHGESCQVARRVFWVRQSLSEPGSRAMTPGQQPPAL